MGGAPIIVWLRPGVGYVEEAAASMARLEAALGRPHDCNSSYRDYDQQEGMYEAWERYVASGFKPALKPPHSRAIAPWLSKHCMGLADDSDDWRTPGYIALAEEHGWIRTAPKDPTEQHHFEYQSWRDQHRTEGWPSGSSSKPFEPKEDTLSAQEVADIKAHITAETNRLRDELAVAVIPSYVQSPNTPTRGKLLRAIFGRLFTPAEQAAITTGYEPGVKLVRYGKSDATGSVFALYEGSNGQKYRYRVTDPAEVAAIGGDVLVMPQAAIWAYGPEQGGFELATDFVEAHPGKSIGFAKSDKTGNLFELFVDSNGNKVRRLLTDPADKASHANAPTMAQADLWAYAPTNQ